MRPLTLSRVVTSKAASPGIASLPSLSPVMIFINYRRSDAQHVVDHLAERLKTVFGATAVFKDDRDVKPGQRWPDEIRNRVLSCEVLLAVIGPTWLAAAHPNHRRRIDDSEDWVRQEISTA